jgi:hypothetical protein
MLERLYNSSPRSRARHARPSSIFFADIANVTVARLLYNKSAPVVALVA